MTESNDQRGSFYVQWHILDRCNLHCRHCYQDQFTDKNEPGWQQLQQAADNLLNMMTRQGKTLDVAVTGGEPFLKPELLRLINYLADSPHSGNISIISNGTIWPPYARQLTTISKFSEMRISLDGVSESTNSAIRGPGTLARVRKNILQWRELNVPVTLMFTVMRRNKHEIPLLVDFAKELGINSIIIERFFPMGQGEEIARDVLDGAEFLEIWRTVLALVDTDADPGDLVAYRGIRIDLHGEEVDILGSGCVVGKDGMALMPNGTVLPCRRFPLPVGNIMEEPLEKIWNHSPVLQALRDKNQLKGKCRTCKVEVEGMPGEKSTHCMGCRAMCYCLTDDFLAEDPHCWL